MTLRYTFTLCCAALLFAAAPARAQHSQHGSHEGHGTSHDEAAQASAPLGPRHGGQVQHTGARAYELVRHERAAMLFLYTHGMSPIAVRPKSNGAPKSGHAHRPGEEGSEADGSVVVRMPDGQTYETALHARTDAMTGATYLRMDLPAGLKTPATFECTVRVGEKTPDRVVFDNPPLVPMHPHAAESGRCCPP